VLLKCCATRATISLTGVRAQTDRSGRSHRTEDRDFAPFWNRQHGLPTHFRVLQQHHALNRCLQVQPSRRRRVQVLVRQMRVRRLGGIIEQAEADGRGPHAREGTVHHGLRQHAARHCVGDALEVCDGRAAAGAVGVAAAADARQHRVWPKQAPHAQTALRTRGARQGPYSRWSLQETRAAFCRCRECLAGTCCGCGRSRRSPRRPSPRSPTTPEAHR